jgi:hypothetical protein
MIKNREQVRFKNMLHINLSTRSRTASRNITSKIHMFVKERKRQIHYLFLRGHSTATRAN